MVVLASQISMNGKPFAHATTQQQRVGPPLVSTSIYSGVHLHQTRLDCARSVESFDPRKTEGVREVLFLFLPQQYNRG